MSLQQVNVAMGDAMDEAKGREQIDNRVDISLKRELKRAARHKEPLSIMLIECHIADEEQRKALFIPIFKQIAGIIRRIIRDEDYEIILGRNLLLILPVTFPDGARTVASKIVRKVSGTAFKNTENFSDFEIHLIIGYASFPNDGSDRSQLLEVARNSLNEEKEKLLRKLSENASV